MNSLHWSVTPPAFCDAAPLLLEFRAAEYERLQAERDFIAAWGTPLEKPAADYMESAFLAEGARYWDAAFVYETP